MDSGYAIILFIALAVYLLPATVANHRKHQNKSAILALNILLGWTFLGWVGALVWAFTAVKPPMEPTNRPTSP